MRINLAELGKKLTGGWFWPLVAVALVGFFAVTSTVRPVSEPQVATVDQTVMPIAEPVESATEANISESVRKEQAAELSANSLPPGATVDGIYYSGEEQIEAMAQAARDAGYDELTAQRIGREAALMCNGNPDCLR